MTAPSSQPAAGARDRLHDALADFSADSRLLVLSALAVVIGAASAAVAWALVALINGITALAYHGALSTGAASPADHRLGPWAALVPVAGGLVIGLMARYGSDKIRGHGIPEALEAILIGESRMSPRVALLKPLSSAIAIGTGGPFGAEGPIIMTGGAVGSLVAQGFHLSAAERKTLLVCGAAAGMSAIFAAPVAAILLAVELLLFEWKPRSFIPVAVAALTAAALRVPLLGGGPIFPVAPHAAPGAAQLASAFALGLGAGLCSAVLTLALYAVEDQFQRLPVHWMWWPALGGVFVGLAGLVDPRILGVGYGTIQALLRGELVGPALIGLLVGKALAWTLALGSGTSGGVLAPLLMMGAGLGALCGGWFAAGDVGLWALLGMAAMMGGTMRSPFTAVVFTLELTHDVKVLPALLASCVASEAVTVLLLRRSILTEKVARRGFHLSREYMVDPLELSRVRDVMDAEPPTVPEDLTVGQLANRIAAGDPETTRHQALPVLGRDGRLAGIVTRGDIMKVLRRGAPGDTTVLEAGERELVVAYPDETVRDAVVKMLRHGIGRLPVVSRDDPRRLVGYLGRANVMAARWSWYRSEHTRARGWAAGTAPAARRGGDPEATARDSA
jgi:CIC family chloride channel protein